MEDVGEGWGMGEKQESYRTVMSGIEEKRWASLLLLP